MPIYVVSVYITLLVRIVDCQIMCSVFTSCNECSTVYSDNTLKLTMFSPVYIAVNLNELHSSWVHIRIGFILQWRHYMRDLYWFHKRRTFFSGVIPTSSLLTGWKSQALYISRNNNSPSNSSKYDQHSSTTPTFCTSMNLQYLRDINT